MEVLSDKLCQRRIVWSCGFTDAVIVYTSLIKFSLDIIWKINPISKQTQTLNQSENNLKQKHTPKHQLIRPDSEITPNLNTAYKLRHTRSIYSHSPYIKKEAKRKHRQAVNPSLIGGRSSGCLRPHGRRRVAVP